LILDNGVIPPENLPGTLGTGSRNPGAILAEIRGMAGSLSLGLAPAALEASIQYANERTRFGRPIGTFQAVAHKIAETATETDNGQRTDSRRHHTMSGYRFRGRTFDQFEPDEVIVTAARTVTEADVVNFAGLSGDYNPLHTDEEFGKTTPFGGRIAHGMLGLAIATGLANQLGVFEGTTLALMQQTVKYTGAIRFGDTIHLELKVAEKKETSKPDRGVITFDADVLNQRGEAVIKSQWVLMIKRGA